MRSKWTLSPVAVAIAAAFFGFGPRTAEAAVPVAPIAATVLSIDDDWEDYQEDLREAREEYEEDVREAREEAYKKALKHRKKALRQHNHHRRVYVPAPVYVPGRVYAPAPIVQYPTVYAPGYYGYPYGGGVHVRFGPFGGVDVGW